MVSGKYSALSGAIAREQSIANISSNLANVSTSGYKKRRISFESILEESKQIESAKGINFNKVSRNYVDFSQGPLSETNSDFDFAIVGDGFFKVRSSEGDFLTRNGNFILSNNGRLLTSGGLSVLDAGGAEIFIGDAQTTQVVVDNEGRIFTVDAEGESSQVSQLGVFDIEDKNRLIPEKDTSFSIPQGVQDFASENFSIVQGNLEISNVNMTDEMSRMISGNRLYEAYHNILESYSKVGEKLSELGTLG